MVSGDSARSRGRIGFSATIYTSMALLQRGMSLILLPFVTRVVSPSEYGMISIVVAVSALIGVGLGAALEVGVFRWNAREESGNGQFLRVCQWYLYVILPLGGLVLSFALWVANSEILGIGSRVWAIEALAASLIPAMTFFALPTVRARDQLAKYVVLAGTSVVLLTAGKVVLVVVLDLGLEGWVVSDLVAAALSYLFAVLLVRSPRTPIDSCAVRRVLWFSLPLLPHRLSFWALTSLSRPAMLIVMTVGQVGLFSLALNIAAVAMLLLSELNRAVLIEYSREKFPAPSGITNSVAQGQVLASFLVPAIIAAGLTIFHGVLFDDRYRDMLELASILLIAHAAFGLYLIPMNYIVQSAGITNWSWLASVLGALTIFLSVFIVGGRFGPVGVAWGTVLGYALMACVAVALTRKLRLEINWRKILPRPLSTSLAATALVSCALSLFYADADPTVARILVLSGLTAIFIHAMTTARYLYRRQ